MAVAGGKGRDASSESRLGAVIGELGSTLRASYPAPPVRTLATQLLGSDVAPQPGVGRWATGIGLLIICATLVFGTYLVYATGGTKYVYVHILYVAIIAGAFFFGIAGGVLTALAATLAIGPMMPLDVAAGTLQPTKNWLLRGVAFVGIGALLGFAFHLLRLRLEQLRRESWHEPLTGLPNRRMLIDTANAGLRQTQPGRGSYLVAVLELVDIARYRDILSVLGPEGVAGFARDFAAAVTRGLDRRACVVYLENLRFALGVPGVDGRDVARLYRQMRRNIRDFEHHGAFPVYVEPRLGIAFHPGHGLDARTLLRNASIAAVDAHERQSNYAVYEPQTSTARAERHALLRDLRHAVLSGDQFELHFQPQIDSADGGCTAVEALVRWHHPERGNVPPGMFIPLAEHTPLIRAITAWVIDEALARLARWQADGLTLTLAVNVSVRDLEDGRFPDRLSAACARHGVAPGYVEVEVTESAVSDNPPAIVAALATLRGRGFRIALDDFGTGQSSLANLARLPVDVVKIDRSLARAAVEDPRSRSIVEHSIAFLSDLDLEIVIEGVEDEAMRELFAGRCTRMQGYLFCPPKPEAGLLDWLETNSSRAWPIGWRDPAGRLGDTHPNVIGG